MDTSKLISTKEAAAILDVSTGYIRRLMREGRLRYEKLDGSSSRLLVRSHVEKFKPGKAGRPAKT